MIKSNQLQSILLITFIIILLYILYIYYSTPVPHQTKLRITVAEAKARRFGLIIDVRTPKERDLLGYYPNSIPISIDKLQQEVPLDISSKNTWILIYSNGDSRAQNAAKTLYKMGYRNVRYINETYLSLMPGSS